MLVDIMECPECHITAIYASGWFPVGEAWRCVNCGACVENPEPKQITLIGG